MKRGRVWPGSRTWVLAVAATVAATIFVIPACRRLEQAGNPAYVASIEKWRTERVAELKRPEGWLALAGLYWLKPGENRFGSAPTNALVFPPGKAPPEAGAFVLEGGQVRVEVCEGVAVTCDGRPVTVMMLCADADSGGPTTLALGPLRFYVIRRGERVGVRLKDLKSPALAGFSGIECYPIDSGWRRRARFERYDPPRAIPIANVLGDVNEERSPGAVVFTRDGRSYRLDAIAEPGSDELFLIFADRTNGRGTYGAGRFLYAPRPGPDGTLEVDFNKAYNPPCAFTPYATCPLPPPQNRLALRVEAGEKNYENHGR